MAFGFKTYNLGRLSYTYQPNVLGITPKIATKWVPILGVWGAGAGCAALFLLEGVPRARADILQKIPVVGKYWVRPVDPEDVPF
ncbi:ubiquinol-cytochrome-c reductase complex subunit-domain-containing protein [Dipodascopsis tothii]|uniref:ubiquinol-cytochrome-c reductase complex subunit-domain-containing protein n=1 Tax=Dipodascopsis tothii TaxID=44089 RepID=UPI0034CF1234